MNDPYAGQSVHFIISKIAANDDAVEKIVVAADHKYLLIWKIAYWKIGRAHV